ncbi:pilus assembly protein TadG-related protein [Altererythrobacter sp.]|nr:pilus assembly protein TadG-related protein [Altererythrobacter sp.]
MQTSGFLRRLAKDKAGNTLALMAAGIVPLIAMVGGAVDMSRAYLASSRLQQACDSGVLAARKYLGSSVIVDNNVPSNVADIGNRFFKMNYKDGEYGTTDRNFQMFMEDDYAVSGEAEVQVPTIVMNMFGLDGIPVDVECLAELSTPSVDVMMAIDVTGSMRHTNSGDTQSRLESLKDVIRNFHAKLEGGKSAGTEMRYGFVPYNANVNVGALLEDDWVVGNWAYQSREAGTVDVGTGSTGYNRNWQYVSGDRGGWVTQSEYPATVTAAPAGTANDNGAPAAPTYSCNGSQPASTYSSSTENNGAATTEPQTEPAGLLTVQPKRIQENGTAYRTIRNGGTCAIQSRVHDNYVQTYEAVSGQVATTSQRWNYRQLSRDVSSWRSESDMCIEERSTYDIGDYDNIDFAQALDLDLDFIPDPANSNTQWRPRYPNLIWGRARFDNNSGAWSTAEVLETKSVYIQPGNWWMSDCPPAAQKMQEMDSDQLDAFLATLEPNGSTYHDIGMIWAGRLLSPTGLFAAENADTASIFRSRHLIWMTDGQTEPYDVAYGAYGLEPLDLRRWDPDTSTLSLTQTVEARFAVACDQVKKLNITVWVIAFGTGTTPIMEECAGEGRYFQAADASQLDDAFTKIADSLGDLRITE